MITPKETFPLRVLLIEDSEDDAFFLLRHLKKNYSQVESLCVWKREEILQALKTDRWDIIICDYTLPHFSGFEALTLCKEEGLDIPFIIISGNIGEDVAVEAMRAGAQDYIMKDNLARLVPAIQRELAEAGMRKQHRQAQEALRVSEEKYRLLVENLNDMIFTVNLDEVFTYISPVVTRITGFSPEELIGEPFSRFARFDQTNPEISIKFFLTIKTTFTFDIEMLTLNGEFIPMRCSIHPRYNTTENPEEIVGILSNLSEQRRMEKALIGSQKLADIGTLTAGVAHEIRTPLLAITGISESLADRLSKGENIKQEDILQYLSNINRNGWRISEITRTLLNYARASDDGVRLHNLNHIIRDTLLLIEHQLTNWSNILVITDLCEDLPYVLCEQNKLTQVIINLLTNARDAMSPKGGTITLSTWYDQPRRQAVLEVTDTGPGIPLKIQKNIFDPFFTTKPLGQGTGLGLSISSEILRKYNGEVRLERSSKEGSVFSVRLPASETDQQTLLLK